MPSAVAIWIVRPTISTFVSFTILMAAPDAVGVNVAPVPMMVPPTSISIGGSL
jgi:hypothetical protein